MDGDSDSESDRFTVSSGRATESSATTYTNDVSMRSLSPIPSVLSLNDDLLANIFRREHGRDINNYSDVYKLPADEEELDRLSKQHAYFVHLMGGKYVPPMAEVMADDTPGGIKAVLDLGCGSGSWILDVARDFPHCQTVAVDLIPMQVSEMPHNLRSEIDDINLGLEHFYGDFNVVHTRLISSGIKDYHLLVDQISRVLRPGGLIDISEFDFHYYDINHRRIDYDIDKVGPPWFSCWMAHLAKAIKQSGGEVEAANHLYDWVSANPDFEDVVYREFFLPAVPQARDPSRETELQKRMYDTLGEDIEIFIRGSHPMLLNSGLAEDFIEMLTANVLNEMKECKIPQFTRLQCVYARKKRE